jgi:uncharacterized SAM-binding protein YcdF (DUF218 family)
MPHPKLTLVLLILFLVLTAFYVMLYTIVSSFDEVDPDQKKRDAAIILGAALWDNKPSPALIERLEMAYTLYANHKVEYLILSGGLGDGGNRISEAEAMKRYLMAKGVPQDRLILEDKSHNTKENLQNTAVLLKKHSFHSLYLVTHDYHMARAMAYAKKAGLEVSPAPVHTRVLFTPYHKTRECFALIKMVLID